VPVRRGGGGGGGRGVLCTALSLHMRSLRPRDKVVSWAYHRRNPGGAGQPKPLTTSAVTCTEHLCIGEQWFEPGGLHRPPSAANVEEVIAVLDGSAEVRFYDVTADSERGQL